MFNIFKKFFNYNEKEIGRLQKQVAEINALEKEAGQLKDDEFKKETEELKERLQSKQQTVNSLLPWAFALTREAAKRILGQRHFDVQLMAGIVLHEGKIAEQKTGEGKTLSATTAMYLNALADKGVHLVTVNDYLARIGAGWMGPVFHFLGLKTSAVINDASFLFDPTYTDADAQDWRLVHLRPISRKEAYLADVTYGINSEFGFDYLRDNMALSASDLVQRGFNYAIIDEADSVLIDEARTPHIISAPFDEDTSKYYRYAQIVRRLDGQTDFVIDEKARTANLTEKGIAKIEAVLNVPNIYEKDFDTLYHIEAALKAETLFKNNKDYIVKDGEVVIVDEFTGRLLPGRRFSEGIHQAIEAKENVSIQRESKTLATVSLQNYFRMYAKLAGMTGTAATEAEEFHKIYKTDVLVLPTHRKMIRQDHADMIYKTEKAKFNAVVEEIAKNYQIGRPVLVGTSAIDKNEYLSVLLTKKGIPHEVLNAKNHLKEAQIIARAGEKGAVTVATNMAGRGVDIILGGQPPTEFEIQNSKFKIQKEKESWQKKHEEIVALRGLYVIGTERHESRRIDNQLRGRAGRQGDPGETRFYVALNDDLMRIFGGEQISKIMSFLKFPEDQPLTHPMVSKAIEQAQVKVEGFNFDIRKHLVDYDDVLNKQRSILYNLRAKVLLSGQNPKQLDQTVFGVFQEEIEALVNLHFAQESSLDVRKVEKFIKEMNFIMPVDSRTVEELTQNNNIEKLDRYLQDTIVDEYEKRSKKFGRQIWMNIVSTIFLSTIDKHWTDHLTAIEDLREGINLRGYAQMDPLVEYKNEAFNMFERLIGNINFEVTRRLFKIEIQTEPDQATKSKFTQPQQPLTYKSASAIDPFTATVGQNSPPAKTDETIKQTTANEIKGFRIIQPGQHKAKPNRNDRCWCGSGKKYKKCHYPN